MVVNLLNLAKELITLKGSTLDLDNFKMFEPIYNDPCPKKLIKCGRQLGKSVCLQVLQLVRACLVPYTRSLTVFPSSKHCYRFSRGSIDILLNESPALSSRFDSAKINTIEQKQLNNGSELFYSYIGDSSTRVRGISVRDFYADELQDIPMENLEIAELCTCSYDNSRFYYSGTPLTFDNVMEGKWLSTSQKEAVVICEHCGFDNYSFIPQVYKMIKPEGLCCQKCEKRIVFPNIIYVPLRTDMVGEFDGYHVPRIFAPLSLRKGSWKEIYTKYTAPNRSESRFANEVLGLSHDFGGKPITADTLKSCCKDMGKYDGNLYQKTIMGIDWGAATQNSLTVICIIGVRMDYGFDVIWAKKYPYQGQDIQVKEALELFSRFRCHAIGSDCGMGKMPNDVLRKYLGFETVKCYQYCAPTQMLKYIPTTGDWSLHRTRSMALLFHDLNNKQIFFPNNFDEFFTDILSVYEEVRETETGGCVKRYNRNHSIPDDFFHALNFGMITAKMLTKDSLLDTITI